MSSSTPSPPLTPPTSDSEREEGGTRPPQLDNTTISSASRPHPISTFSPHPFAASIKANRPPPAYEKKLVTPPATPPEHKTQITPRHSKEDKEVKQRPTIQRAPSVAEREQKRWDNAIALAVDTADPKLDLSGMNLTYIPSSIIDLKSLVVLSKLGLGPTVPRTFDRGPTLPRTFARSMTAPALLPLAPMESARRPFMPSRTTNALDFGRAHQRGSQIELYLMRNAIRSLPGALFALDRLVVLSLRQNKLTSLPPAIGQLTRLRELNIANNRLAHLPAEIQQLHLTTLHLHPNPFTPPPACEPEQKTRHLGPLKRSSYVPALSEIILRVLLGGPTGLEAAMSAAEIDALPLPPHFQRIVRASTGRGECVDAEMDVRSNVCPSPAHRDRASLKGVRFVDERCPARDHVFCTPTEERMEWVGVVAGVQVAESPQGWVPVLWRGCQTGCLDFLGEVLQKPHALSRVFEAGEGEAEEFEFSDEES